MLQIPVAHCPSWWCPIRWFSMSTMIFSSGLISVPSCLCAAFGLIEGYRSLGFLYTIMGFYMVPQILEMTNPFNIRHVDVHLVLQRTSVGFCAVSIIIGVV